MTDLRALLGAGAIALLSLSPSFAMGLFPGHPGHGGGKPPHSRAAPGPVVGVGLPVLAVAGGYIWYRRRSRRKK